MTTATVGGKGGRLGDSADFWLNLLTGWHFLLAAGSLAGVGTLWLRETTWPAWFRWLLTGLLLLAAIVSLSAALNIRRRRHRGRFFSLALNYLGFLICLIGALHLIGFFTGLDSLANSFGRGLPFLVLAIAGFFVHTLAENSYNVATQRAIRQSGRVMMWFGIAAMLVAIGVHNGVITLFTSLGDRTVLALTAGTVLFGLLLWAMWRAPSAQALGVTSADAEMLSGYLFLSPNLLGFLLFFAGPLMLSLYVSFTNWDAFGTQDWVGLDNYARITDLSFSRLESSSQLAAETIDMTRYDELTRFEIFGQNYLVGARDKLFWLSLRNTLVFVLLAVPLSVLPALFLSSLLNSKIPGMKFFRAVYFLPSVAAVVGIALVWQWLFNATIGYINYFITSGINLLGMIGLELTDPQIRWLSDSKTALLAVVIVAAWQWMGFNTVLFLAGLQNIPRSLYEAATVDGANSWQQFRRVTLPLLAPTTFFVITTTTIQAMQIFEQVFILIPTNPAGPNNSTLTLVLYLYQKGFQRFEQGYASAIAWVLFIIIFGVTLARFQWDRTRGSSHEG